MTTEPDPTLDDAPLDSAVGEAARPTRPPFDLRTQLACGSGFAVAVIGLLGSFVGAWPFDFTGLILIVAGLVGFGTAYVSFGRDVGSPTVANRDLILAGGTISAALGILFVAEILTDLDGLDAYGGVFGLILTLGLGIAGVVLYYAATEWWDGGPAAPWTAALASGDRPTRNSHCGCLCHPTSWRSLCPSSERSSRSSTRRCSSARSWASTTGSASCSTSLVWSSQSSARASGRPRARAR